MGMSIVMEHLIGLGHRKIALVGGEMRVNSTFLKYQKYREILAQHGIEENGEYVVNGTYDPETGVVDVECSRDVQEVVFKSNTPWPDKGYQKISGSGRASYRIMYEDRYVRIELIDDRGRKAWCSPFAVK